MISADQHASSLASDVAALTSIVESLRADVAALKHELAAVRADLDARYELDALCEEHAHEV